MSRSRSHHRPDGTDLSVEKYGEKTKEKEECDELLLGEYATLMAFYIASVATLIGVALQRRRPPRRFSAFDLAMLGVATPQAEPTRGEGTAWPHC